MDRFIDTVVKVVGLIVGLVAFFGLLSWYRYIGAAAFVGLVLYVGGLVFARETTEKFVKSRLKSIKDTWSTPPPQQ